jgi:hypothetical protein
MLMAAYVYVSKPMLTAVGTRFGDHTTLFYPQKLALSSPTSDGHSVGIARFRTERNGVSLFCFIWYPSVS